ncbi:hypothetical protein [Haloarcula brevis]|uniref:hypothetical protein n=1 Tax=Haloarcula brevis TaxID=3111453 RepID=UPI00300F6335
MRRSRRAFVTTLVAVGSGCLGSSRAPTPTTEPDADGDGVPDAVDDYPTDARRAFRSFRMAGTETLQPGQFSAVALMNSPRARGDVLHYDVTVEGSAGVDCLVFDRAAYDAYQDGDRDVAIVPEYSRTGVTEATLTRTLDEGEYVFSLDYTDLLTEPGDASATVRRSLSLSEPASE